MVDRVPATMLAALADLVKWMDVTKMPQLDDFEFTQELDRKLWFIATMKI